jgi:hypothetical protein
MITGLVDHLWQSCCCCGVAWIFSMTARGNAAIVRLWLWRIAALKLLLPFSLLFALGGWLGFPSPHPADPAPAALIGVIGQFVPFASPARAYGWTGFALLFAAFVTFAGAGACGYAVRQRLRIERMNALEEAARQARDIDDIRSRPGFFVSASMSAFVLAAVSIPMLAGAAQDRQQRRQRLIVNSLSLRDAHFAIRPSATGMGTRYRIVADAHGVTIRNANIHDLVAIVYGVRRHAVITPQMMVQGESAARSWLHWPRYDVRVEAPVPDPRDFEPYALRQGLTKLLAVEFGLEIYVNGDCQPPCGNYRVALADDPL